jgi:hypothetical protein
LEDLTSGWKDQRTIVGEFEGRVGRSSAGKRIREQFGTIMCRVDGPGCRTRGSGSMAGRTGGAESMVGEPGSWLDDQRP